MHTVLTRFCLHTHCVLTHVCTHTVQVLAHLHAHTLRVNARLCAHSACVNTSAHTLHVLTHLHAHTPHVCTPTYMHTHAHSPMCSHTPARACTLHTLMHLPPPMLRAQPSLRCPHVQPAPSQFSPHACARSHGPVVPPSPQMLIVGCAQSVPGSQPAPPAPATPWVSKFPPHF